MILPVAIPPDTKPEEALNDNERYKVVWQILNALRAHDERLDARINQAELGEDISDKVGFVRISSETELKELTAVVDDFATTKTKAEKQARASVRKAARAAIPAMPRPRANSSSTNSPAPSWPRSSQKCGTREYWDTWARDIAKIAQTHITRITTIVGQPGAERDAFLAFLEELQDDLNPEITEAEAIEMLAQHLITRPVFDALFKGSQFTKGNPVSRAMETVLGQLHEHNLAKESESLSKFYASVERRAADVVTANGRQELIYKLYDSFFKGAFPVLTQRLGIVYTPVEVVDFILHSVNDVLKAQFGQTLGSEGVHILDPFTGTGTFISRLLQSGLIAPDELARKYREEIHANEIVLLAYYIAAINIETVYHELMQGELTDDTPYEPFKGILLTDTFQMYEQERDMVANLLPDNSERRTRQKALDIRVIIGNPPYSAGQGSANDNAANIAYPTLDAAIRDRLCCPFIGDPQERALYDSYIRAIRWASTGSATRASWPMSRMRAGLTATPRTGCANASRRVQRPLRIPPARQSRTSWANVAQGRGTFSARAPAHPSPSAVSSRTPMRHRAWSHPFSRHRRLSRPERKASSSATSAHRRYYRREEAGNGSPDENNDWLIRRSQLRQVSRHRSKATNSCNPVFEIILLGLRQRDAWAITSSPASLAKHERRMSSIIHEVGERWNPSEEAQDIKKFRII